MLMGATLQSGVTSNGAHCRKYRVKYSNNCMNGFLRREGRECHMFNHILPKTLVHNEGKKNIKKLTVMGKTDKIFWHNTFLEHKQFASSTSLVRTSKNCL